MALEVSPGLSSLTGKERCRSPVTARRWRMTDRTALEKARWKPTTAHLGDCLLKPLMLPTMTGAWAVASKTLTHHLRKATGRLGALLAAQKSTRMGRWNKQLPSALLTE